MSKNWYVRNDECQPIGPFDTERDAVLCRDVLNYLVDWYTWYTYSTTADG